MGDKFNADLNITKIQNEHYKRHEVEKWETDRRKSKRTASFL